MTLSKLIFKNAMRHKLRTILTVLGLAIAITSYAIINTVLEAWYFGVNMASENRIVTRNAISIISPLPLAYKTKIKSVEGVTDVAYGNWFGGFYKTEKNFIAIFSVSPNYIDLYPEILIDENDKRTYLSMRNSCIVGRALAKRFGWKKGDTIRITGTIFAGEWDFYIAGIYHGAKKSTDETMFFFHWEYLNERIKETGMFQPDEVGWFLLHIDNPDYAAQISEKIDAQFKNSSAETITETEKAFQLGFLSMTDAIIQALRIVSIIIILVILVILSNTMAMAARERIPEYATLKTFGFNGLTLTYLIMGESVVIAILGAILGTIATFPLANYFAKLVETFLPVFKISPETIVYSFFIAIGVGISAAIFPSLNAAKTPIATSLRKIG
ncbi:MAG: FtsX-like permease family protein [Candidatus Schekmanbacteria bacterium]|nr:MAG: FtsX-like permease family protein [Candidatus Schekmanbacteria bacterium]